MPGIGDAELEVAGVPAADVDLQPVIVRGAGTGDQVDVGVALVRAKGINTQGGEGSGAGGAKRISILWIQVQKPCAVGNGVQVNSLSEVTGERTDVTDLEEGLEADLLLDTYREVIDGRRPGVDLDGVQCGRPFQRGADEVDQVVYVPEIYRHITLIWRVADQVTARCPAAGARAVINSSMSSQHRSATSKNVEGKAESRFPLNGRRIFEPVWNIRVSPDRNPVKLI